MAINASGRTISHPVRDAYTLLAVVCASDAAWSGPAARLRFHRRAQQLIDPRLIPTPLSLEPSQYIGIHANRDRGFDRPVELSDDRVSPVQNFWYVCEIDFVVGHTFQRG